MHAIAHILPAVLVLGLFVAIVVKMHLADSRSTDKPEVKVAHKTCAFVDLSNGKERTVEPGFADFFVYSFANALTLDDRKSRIHLKPEPV